MYERAASSNLQLFVGQVLKNTRLWLIVAAYVIVAAMQQSIFLGVLNVGVFVDHPSQLVYQQWCSSAVVLGIAVACWCSDRLPKGTRLFTSGLFQSGMVLICIAMLFIPSDPLPPKLVDTTIFFMSFFMAGAYCALLLSAFEVIDSRILGVTIGFAWVILYILKVYVMFYLLKYLGWEGDMAILIPLGILSAIGLLYSQAKKLSVALLYGIALYLVLAAIFQLYPLLYAWPMPYRYLFRYL